MHIMSLLCEKWRTVQTIAYVGVEILKWAEQTIGYFLLICPVNGLIWHVTRNVDSKMHELNNSKINIVSTFGNKIPKSILVERTSGGRTFAGGAEEWMGDEVQNDATRWLKKNKLHTAARYRSGCWKKTGVAMARKWAELPWEEEEEEEKEVKVCKFKIRLQ